MQKYVHCPVKVININTGESKIYMTQAEAAKELGCAISTVNRCISLGKFFSGIYKIIFVEMK